jgi:hypothetical protein
MKACELAICIDVLFHKKWSRTLVNGQLKSESWWERRRKTLIESPAIQIETPWEPKPIDTPVPYEIEMKLEASPEKTGL